MEHSIPDFSASRSALLRKRGRPAGKSRKALSTEERKARNAQYERERRNEIGEATSQLVEATNSDQSVSIANLLTTAIQLIQNNHKRNQSQSIDILKKRNEDLEKEIHELEYFLLTKRKNHADESESEGNSEMLNKRKVKRKTDDLPSSSSETQKSIVYNDVEVQTYFNLDIDPSDNLWGHLV